MKRGASWVLFLVVTCAMGCDCRPVQPTAWSDLRLQCNGHSDFAKQGTDQVVLDTRAKLEDFLKRDCLRDETAIAVPAVDFSKRIVIVDATFSPLEDGTCIASRKVSEVDACVGGVQILYDDVPGDCSRRLLTGSISIDRQEARVAFATVVDGTFSQ